MLQLIHNHNLLHNQQSQSQTLTPTSTPTHCLGCIKGKQHRVSFNHVATHRSTQPLQLIHTDVCGPMQTTSLGGARYFITFIDDYTRYTTVYTMKQKSEAFHYFTQYKQLVEKQHQPLYMIKALRSDGGGEYVSNVFKQYLVQHGIQHQQTPPYTPEHNGVAERMNRTLVECARSMLHDAMLSYVYWGEAIMTACYIRNRSPTRSLLNTSLGAITPYEGWFGIGNKPSIAHLRVFGCKAYAHVPDAKRKKLDSKSVECIFIGYDIHNTHAYRLYDVMNKRIMVSHDVTFIEDSVGHVDHVGQGGNVSNIGNNVRSNDQDVGKVVDVVSVPSQSNTQITTSTQLSNDQHHPNNILTYADGSGNNVSSVRYGQLDDGNVVDVTSARSHSNSNPTTFTQLNNDQHHPNNMFTHADGSGNNVRHVRYNDLDVGNVVDLTSSHLNSNSNPTTSTTLSNNQHHPNNVLRYAEGSGMNVSDVRYNDPDDGLVDGLDDASSNIQSSNPNNQTMYSDHIDGAEHDDVSQNDRMLQQHVQVDDTSGGQIGHDVDITRQVKRNNHTKHNIPQSFPHDSEHNDGMQQLPTSIPRRSNRQRSRPISYWDASAVEAYNRKHTNVAQVMDDSDLVVDRMKYANNDEVALVNVSDDQDKCDEVDDPTHGSHSLSDITLGNLNIDNEPTTYTQAMNSDNHIQWEKAMQDEYDSIQSCGTWSLVKLPNNRKAIGCKWVYKIKRNADGSIDRYKARLVAKGFSQKEGIDYNETFAPVAKFCSIRALLALAARDDMEIHQMDVKTAFLNGDLDVDIYMQQPQGYVVDGKEDYVCKLHKSLYGLKQAGRAWYQKIDNVLLHTLGFTRSQADHCVYVYNGNDGIKIYIALYVDDLLIMCNNIHKLTALKQHLSTLFDMKDLGEAHYVLGIQIERDRKHKVLHISQREYIKNVLDRFQMSECNPLSTPMDVNVKLSKQQCPTSDEDKHKMQGIPYQSAVGAIMYAMLGTRPDIAYAITTLSQYCNNPGYVHWIALKRVLRYLRGTMDYKLTYGDGNVV